MYKKIFSYSKKSIKRLFQKLNLINPDNENPAPILLETYEQYYLISNLLSIALKNIDPNKISNSYIIEAGIGRGNTFQFLSLISEKIGSKIIGFDSFRGFPEITNPRDRRMSNKKLEKGQWNVITKKSLLNKLRNSGVGKNFIENNVEIIEGYFDQSMVNFDKNKKTFFLHLDVDLYSSYKTCLESLWDNVMEGGIVLFDEYHDKKWPDAKYAIDEFFNKKNIKIEVDELFKRGFVIKNYPD